LAVTSRPIPRPEPRLPAFTTNSLNETGQDASHAQEVAEVLDQTQTVEVIRYGPISLITMLDAGHGLLARVDREGA
jgi:hypothetical protein